MLETFYEKMISEFSQSIDLYIKKNIFYNLPTIFRNLKRKSYIKNFKKNI